MDDAREIITENAQETQRLGERLAANGAGIVCLYGELGSGKTTFAQGFAKGLGMNTRLLSPTFIIVRRYDLPKNFLFYHIDLYRIHSTREMEGLGLSEIFSDSEAHTLIEWSERLGSFLPEHRTDIFFSVLPNGRHKIVIT